MNTTTSLSAEPATEPVPELSEAVAPTRLGWRDRLAPLLLAGSMLVLGACGIIYEYCLGVLGNYLMGSSHEQLLVIIGLMMCAMGVGAALQRFIVGLLIDYFILIELVLGVLGGLSAILIYATFQFTIHYLIVLYFVAILIGMLIGAEIPLLIRINATYLPTLRNNLSLILGMDYFGSLVGALFFTYVLLSALSLEKISLLLGLVNLFISLVGLVYFWPFVYFKRALLLGIGIGTLTLLAAWSQAQSWMRELEQMGFEDPIVHAVSTNYQRLVLTKRNERIRLYINNHLQYSATDEHIYHELLTHPAMLLAPQRQCILILGGGDGLALREVLKYDDVHHVTLVDIDPLVIQLAQSHPLVVEQNQRAFSNARVHTNLTAANAVWPAQPNLPPNPKHLDVFTIDADLFLRHAVQQYDVVLLDFPDPRTIELAKLFSVEFYRQLATHLTPTGIMALQATSPYRAQEVFLCIGQTLRAAGWHCVPYHEHVPSFGEWGWYLAQPEQHLQTPLDVRQVQAHWQRLAALPIPTRYLSLERLPAVFTFGKRILDINQKIQPNTRLNPIITKYHKYAFLKDRTSIFQSLP